MMNHKCRLRVVLHVRVTRHISEHGKSQRFSMLLRARAAPLRSALRTTLIRYGGFSTLGSFTAPAIDLVAADILLDGVAIESCKAQGLRLNV